MNEMDWKAEKVPASVKVALRVLLQHVEPGWLNCWTLVKAWLDGELVDPDKVKP